MPCDRRLLIGAAGAALAGAAAARVKLSSKKKGFCGGGKSPGWQKKLTGLNAKWFYNWGAFAPEGSPAGIEFVPMQWGKWGCNADKMKRIKKAQSQTLLGFNEPDQKKQANMSVEKALELWPILMESGLRLGSPAGVHPDGEWMKAFMKEAKKRKYRVDFVTVHSYGGASPKHFMKKLKSVHKLYDLPIWVTEFAVADWNAGKNGRNKFSQTQILKFMEDALPAMEKCDYVERYAWFSAGQNNPALGTSGLFNEDGSLNKLGRFYASI